jgi:hypothetical protein
VTVQPQSGPGPAPTEPPSTAARSVIPHEAVARRVARSRHGFTVVTDFEAHGVVIAGHCHVDPGGVAGVLQGIGDRFPSDVMDRTTDRMRQAVELTRQGTLRREATRPSAPGPADRAPLALRGGMR